VIVIGTSGEVMPACLIVREAKRAGAKIIEVNIDDSSSYCRDGVTDILLAGQAGNIMAMLLEELKK
jgi:NAD-dependent deacetylase